MTGIKLAHGALTIVQTGTSFDDKSALSVPLGPASAQSDTIDLFPGGWVDEQTYYTLGLEVSSTAEVTQAALSVDEGEEIRLEIVPKAPRSAAGGLENAYLLRTNPEDGGWNVRKPFALTCGFARVTVRVCVGAGSWVELASKDIVALTRQTVEHDNIRGMYEELLDTDDNPVADWMFARADGRDEYGTTDWSASSLQGVIATARRIVARMQFSPVGTDPYAGARAALASDVAAKCEHLLAEVESDVEKSRELEVTLSDMRREAESRFHDQRSLPAYAVVSARIAREAAYAEALKDTKTEAHSVDGMIRGRLGAPVPDYDEARKQASANAELTADFAAWEPFRKLEFTRESRALHAAKPDKLYEYYVVFRLLKWLRAQGFALDTAAERPVNLYRYSYESTYEKYANERRSSNTFRLARGDERVTLYYQPVIYGDGREENGITLHRTIAAHPFDAQNAHTDAAWTPDILLETLRGGERRVYALDAKYRNLYELAGLMPDGTADHRVTTSVFEDTIRKYKTDLSDDAGRGISAVWLVCGRGTEAGTLPFRRTEWGSAHIAQSGLASLTYGMEGACLDEMMADLGIGGSED